jgi:hypothetical protein
MRIKTAISLMVVAALLVIPSAAFATSPTTDNYSGVQGVSSSGTTPPSAGVNAATEEVAPVSEEAVSSSGSSLPFTGLDVGVIALVGLGLIGTGVALYRVNRQPAVRL